MLTPEEEIHVTLNQRQRRQLDIGIWVWSLIVTSAVGFGLLLGHWIAPTLWCSP